MKFVQNEKPVTDIQQLQLQSDRLIFFKRPLTLIISQNVPITGRMKMTEQQKKILLDWLENQTYSGRGERVGGNYLLFDELAQYLPAFLEKLLRDECNE